LLEVGVEGVAEEFEDAATLLAAGRDHRPDAFTPTLPAFAAGSLKNYGRLRTLVDRWIELLTQLCQTKMERETG
jgi:hypothetical protein